jgi:hypothetical protein
MAELKADHPEVFDDVELSVNAEARVGPLPFYKRYVLVELPVSRGRGPESVFALHIPKSARETDEKSPTTLWLNGESASMHRANEVEEIDLAQEHALDYLRYFVNFLRAGEGAFTLLESTDLIGSAESDMTPTEQLELVASRERFLSGTSGGAGETQVIDAGYEARFPIAYGTHLADLAKFKISRNGEVEMIVSTADEGGQPRSAGALSVLAIPEFRGISPAVLRARRDMPPADRDDPGALGRRLASANKLGEAGRERPDSADDEARQYYSEAIGLLRDIVSDYVQILGPDHSDTVLALSWLEYWRLMRSWGEPCGGYDEEALREVRRLLVTQMRSLGPFHSRTLKTRRNIALMLTRSDGGSPGGADDAGGAWDRAGHVKAIAILQGLITDIREHLAEDPPAGSSQRDKLEEVLADSQLSLAQVHHEMYAHHVTADDETAIDELKTLLASPKSEIPAVAKVLTGARYCLAEYLFEAGRADEAIAQTEASLAELRAAETPDEREIGYSAEQLERFQGGGEDGGTDAAEESDGAAAGGAGAD